MRKLFSQEKKKILILSKKNSPHFLAKNHYVKDDFLPILKLSEERKLIKISLQPQRIKTKCKSKPKPKTPNP